MIADPTLRRDARLRIERDRIARRARRQRGARRPRRPARTAWPTRTWPPAPPTSATSEQRILGQLSGEQPASVLARPGDADRPPGARPLAQRDGRARPATGPGLRHRGGGPGQPHGDRRRGAGDPRRRRPGPVPRPGPRRRGWSSSTATRGWSSSTPTPPTQTRYRQAAAERAARFEGWPAWPTSRPRRSTAVPVELWGNIEFPGEVAACLERGAIGVGLYRTEFLFLNADRPPTEDEQFEAYAAVVRSMQGRPVTIRTLDLGADKLVAYQSAGYAEPNPALGLRSLRLSLRDPGSVPDPAPGDPPGQRPGRRPGHVPPGLDPGRVPPGPRHPRRGRRRADRRGGRRSARTCRSASWSRCPPPP